MHGFNNSRSITNDKVVSVYAENQELATLTQLSRCQYTEQKQK